MKFHYRRIKRLITRLREIEQAKPRQINVIELSKNRELVVYTQLYLKASDVNKLAMESKSKLNKIDKLPVNLRAQAGNKEVESYKFAFSAFSEMNYKGES